MWLLQIIYTHLILLQKKKEKLFVSLILFWKLKKNFQLNGNTTLYINSNVIIQRLNKDMITNFIRVNSNLYNPGFRKI